MNNETYKYSFCLSSEGNRFIDNYGRNLTKIIRDTGQKFVIVCETQNWVIVTNGFGLWLWNQEMDIPEEAKEFCKKFRELKEIS